MANPRPRTRLSVVCALLVTSALLHGVASADPDPTGARPPQSWGQPPDADAQLLQENAHAAGALGIYIDGQTGEYVVVGPPGSLSDLSSADLAPDGLKVRVETRNISRELIDEIQGQLAALHSDPRIEGETYHSGFDPRSGQVVLEATAPVEVFADVIDAFPGLVVYREGTEVLRLSRSNDGEPHWGGINLQGPCTGGFTVAVIGFVYLVTAGHCGTIGQAILQPNGNTIGSVKAKAAFPGTDILLIGGETYSGRIYTGGACCQSNNKPVKGAGDPVVGGQYCFGGATTFETCSHRATDTDEQICFPTGCTNHLAVLTGGVAPQFGDSGGPVYINGSGGTTVYIRGIIIGKNGANTQFYIHKWSTIQSWSGTFIVIG